MTAIDINALTEEQKKQIAANFAAEEKAKKEKKAADKKLLKGLENDVEILRIGSIRLRSKNSLIRYSNVKQNTVIQLLCNSAEQSHWFV